MQNLQVHQLRVASVAMQIVDSLKIQVDRENILKTCLLHDMGNIIKFDLGYFPEFTQPEGLGYWENVKSGFIEKYGPNEHVASVEIAKELGVGEKVLEYMDAISFSKNFKNTEESFEYKICNYADQRVGPFGVISISERIADGKERYKNFKHKAINSDDFEKLCGGLYILEKQIFAESKIKPTLINDESIKKILSELKEFDLN